ncbi:MAG: hypothetical protein ACE5FZ_09455 [Nitrospiria bacterium]
MEEKQHIIESGVQKRSTKEATHLSRLTFEDRLFLDTITRTTFPDRLKQRRPKFFDRLQGKLESVKREVIQYYRKDQKMSRR